MELQDFSALSARDDRDDGRAARESRVHVAAVRDAVAALLALSVEQRVGVTLRRARGDDRGAARVQRVVRAAA